MDSTSPLPLLIAGPCVIESEAECLLIAREAATAAAEHGFDFVFKASFDKANRTSGDAFRGPGLRAGLDILARVRDLASVRVTTDVHLPSQVEAVAKVVDVIQIPAFLCRQTDLLIAAGAAGRVVNLKKGQFLAPSAVAPAVEKIRAAGAPEVWVTERGTAFGHGDLVVDFRGTPGLQAAADRAVFDATHSAQRPPSTGGERSTGGRRADVPVLACAAAGAGFDALFVETHPDPRRARSDAATQWHLSRLPELLRLFGAVVEARRR